MSSSFDQKEQIRDAIDIVDLVSRYVPLQRRGRLYIGRCPWHDDSRPSLQVNPDRQTFKCWVCDIGGDIFSFMMQIEKVEFREAIELLAEQAGITLVKDKLFEKKKTGNASITVLPEGEISSGEYTPVQIDKRVLFRALDWLSLQYHDIFLHWPEAAGARDYIASRGINEEMIRQFQIGYAPVDPSVLINMVKGDRNRVAVLEAAGVIARWEEHSAIPTATTILSTGERRGIGDRFRGRVLFPIRDTQRRTIAFGGRILPLATFQSPAKYINSPETLVFSKHKTLFGFDIAQVAIQETKRQNAKQQEFKPNRVIITEGYTDCIMAHQYGFPETVAVLGTALGPEHIKILKRFTDKMYLVLDGDAAGRRRTKEVLGHFVEQGVDLNILTLPNEKDPCDFLIEEGHDAFEHLLQTEALDAMEYVFNAELGDIDVDRDIVAASRALDKLLTVTALFPTHRTNLDDPIRLRMEKTIQRLARRFHLEEKVIRERIAEHRNRQRPHQRDVSVVSEKGDQRGDDHRPYSQTFNEAFAPSSDRDMFVYPIAEIGEETDEYLQKTYSKLPFDIWHTKHLLPPLLDEEYLQFWFAAPEFFAELSKRIPNDALWSPITRQLDLLGRNLLKRGILPRFDELIIRYEDQQMKKYLITVDEAGQEKNLTDRIQSDSIRDDLMNQIANAFERRRLAAGRPKQLDELTAPSRNSEGKAKMLQEIQKTLQKEQQTKSGSIGVREDIVPEVE